MNNLDNSLLKKKKILNYSIIIGSVSIIIIIIVVTFVVIKSKQKDNTDNDKSQINPKDPWDNLIPSPSEEKMKELIQNSYNITTSMTQEEIQEILSNDLYQIIHFETGIYNLKIESDKKINALFDDKFSLSKLFILIYSKFLQLKNIEFINETLGVLKLDKSNEINDEQ